MNNTPHPAKYTNSFIPIFSEMSMGCKRILDPFSGTGKIFELKAIRPELEIFGVELEPEWANSIIGNSLNLPFSKDSFDCIITSPTYGNRMADHHNAKDSSKRNTYTHVIGRKLSKNNSGSMQWGDEYRKLHENVWLECKRVLINDGIFILNIKDHIRKGVIQKVTDWHIEKLEKIGFAVLEHRKIKCSGNGFGKNSLARIGHESIILFKLNP